MHVTEVFCHYNPAQLSILFGDKKPQVRFDYCKFIDNDGVFMRGSDVNRHLLSRDGLHLSPRGKCQLIGLCVT
ncbi:hypothetical protein LSTR_LSTR011705 [Laodelphax striatellus]|uniref:Uncharacterized protein n=1 Tax=Laodelphax striatellus TaxID=195883 RepID=A0A482WVE7_LAOST|nr:hypothetical protein LSTR_LSTR011705 [Laodelphax striatellus]